MECEYLHLAHMHEAPPEIDQRAVPNSDIEMTEEFFLRNHELYRSIVAGLVEGARQKPGATDYDFREALDSLTRSARGLEGAKPSAIFDAVEASVAEKSLKLTDTPVVTLLAFVQGLEYEYNNQRRLSRAFYDFLLSFRVNAMREAV